MGHYSTPQIVTIDILAEGCIMTGSTGEQFEMLEDYDGTWA